MLLTISSYVMLVTGIILLICLMYIIWAITYDIEEKGYLSDEPTTCDCIFYTILSVSTPVFLASTLIFCIVSP